ncbi:hypothetical protein [Shewanella putrefaciens]|uniref:hypothetical protein n=2 Tax=Shewanella TaxID=22 RepID=UPI0028634FA0|nr:hypothetical protein [Shewanella putrefaciens]MDR6962499.1 hypothetical protein [Shewanella putrefaciens]
MAINIISEGIPSMAVHTNSLVNFIQKNDQAISLFLFVSSLFIIISHLFMYCSSDNSNWIGSAGAFITISGIVYSSLQLLKTEYSKEIMPAVVLQSKTWMELPTIPGAFANIVTKEKAEEINQRHFDKVNSKYAKIYIVQILMILGTCIWSYAWLLDKTH